MVGSRTVLVVEPDDDRGGLAAALRSAGVNVESVGDAARALPAIEANRHAIIVVDPSTAGVDPDMLAGSVRAVAPRPVVLVLIDKLDPRRGFSADVVHGYIRRGDNEQLAQLIRDCLAALCECGTASQSLQSPGLSLRSEQ
jgi:DNA-binding NtrC family response regulator